MSWIVTALASFFGAALSALGMGGGGILLIYLTAYLQTPQQTAQGINLVFFIPIAVTALLIHAKNKLIHWRIVLACVASGLPGVWLGATLALSMDSQILGKLFGCFLLFIGAREFFAKPKGK